MVGQGGGEASKTFTLFKDQQNQTILNRNIFYWNVCFLENYNKPTLFLLSFEVE